MVPRSGVTAVINLTVGFEFWNCIVAGTFETFGYKSDGSLKTELKEPS